MMHERTYHSRVLKDDSESKSPKRFPLKSTLITLCVLGVCTGIVFLLRAPFVQIRDVQVEGIHVADPIDVSQFVLNRLEGNHVYVIPRTSTFLVSTKHLAERIKVAFPRFETVTVERTNFHTLSVSVQEYAGEYLWCEHSSDECVFMDIQGVAFAPAPYFSGDAYVRVYSGERGELPFDAVSPEDLTFIKLVSDRLGAIGIEATSFDFVSEHRLEVSFVHNGTRSYIYMEPKADTEAALEALYTGMRAKVFATLYHDRAQVLEYIDLRFANKMVYKFK